MAAYMLDLKQKNIKNIGYRVKKNPFFKKAQPTGLFGFYCVWSFIEF